MINQPEQIKPVKITFKRFLPGIFLAFLVLIGMSFFGDLRQISAVLSDFKWQYYPFVLLLTLINYSIRYIKWNYFLKLIGTAGLPHKESIRIFLAGFPLAVTPGKVGEALKGFWVNQKTGIPVGRTISVVVSERISDGLAVIILSAFGVIAYPGYWPGFLIVMTGLLSLVVLSQTRSLALKVLGIGEKLPLVKRFTGSLMEFYEGSFSIFRPGSALVGVGLGIIHWFGEGIAFFLILIGFGIPPSIEGLSIAVFVVSFSTIVGAVSALPGGLGAVDLSMAGMLTFIVGLDPATATSATILFRLATLWFKVFLGLLVWIISPSLIGLKGSYGKEAR